MIMIIGDNKEILGWGWDDVLPYFLKSENNELGQISFIMIKVQLQLQIKKLI